MLPALIFCHCEPPAPKFQELPHQLYHCPQLLRPAKPNAQLRTDLKASNLKSHDQTDGRIEVYNPGDPDAMQRSQVICAACRRQRAVATAHRIPAPRSPQWHSRASSSTASAETRPLQHHTDEEFTPSIDASDTNQQEDPKEASQSVLRFTHLARKPNFRKFAGGTEGSQESLRIFRRVVKQQASQKKPNEKEREQTPASLQFYNDLSQLRPMMQVETIDKCFDFFLTKLWNNQPFEGRNRLLKQRGTYLLGKVTDAKISDMDNEKLPSVARITQMLHEMESLSAHKWTWLIMGLIRSIITKSGVGKDYTSFDAYETAMASKEKHLEDLVESWVVFHRHLLRTDAVDFQSSGEAQFRLPDINEAALRSWRYSDIRSALSMIFPEHLIRAGGGHQWIPAAALATFVLMVDPAHSTVNTRLKAKPLLKPIGRILAIIRVPENTLFEILKPYPDVLAYVLKLWDTVTTRLRGDTGTKPQRQGKLDAKITLGILGQTGDIDTDGIHQKVTDALKMGDVVVVENAWRQYWGKGLEDPRRMEQLKVHEDHKGMFKYFIMAFTALRRPQRAIDVWDCMASINIEPTLKTWTSIMEGCRKAKNPVGLENIWKKLVAGVKKLDSAVWSTRIVALIDCGEPEAGLRALSEMATLSNQGGVELDIYTVNAAVASLIRLNAMSAARKVLIWASEHKVEADIVTYNILLRPAVSQGDARGVANLISLMSEQGIEPDSATWTILLDGLIADTKHLSPAEQNQSVTKLLADIEAAGAETNMETCARMLHLLLHDGGHSGHHTQGAVGAIFDHIRGKGLQPSTHIYTMLIEDYFRRVPPALDEVEKLLSHRGLQLENGRMDRIFWERLISGYAIAGHVDRAFELFTSAGHVAAWMTLQTLEMLLRSLVRGGRMAEAQSVVNKVKLRRAGVDPEDVNGGPPPLRGSEFTQRRHWNHGFWSFAQDCGLLTAYELRELQGATRSPVVS